MNDDDDDDDDDDKQCSHRPHGLCNVFDTTDSLSRINSLEVEVPQTNHPTVKHTHSDL